MFIRCFYPDSPRVSSDPTCPKPSSFSSLQKPVLTLLNSLLQWTIHCSSHFLCLVSSLNLAFYKHPHPTNLHWFHFILFLHSMYISISPFQLWPWLFLLLTSMMGQPPTSSVISLGFSSHLLPTLQPELSPWWANLMIHSFIQQILLEHLPCARHWAKGLRHSPYLQGVYSLGLGTAENLKQMNYFKNYKGNKYYEGNK